VVQCVSDRLLFCVCVCACVCVVIIIVCMRLRGACRCTGFKASVHAVPPHCCC